MQLFAFLFGIPPDSEVPIWIVVVAITAIALLFTGFLSWFIIRQVAKSRELSHLERMRALELGQVIGPSEPSEAEKGQGKYLHNAFWISFWIGAGVPIAATSGASSLMSQTNLHEFSVIIAIWTCVAVISVASVVCATVLMISSRQCSSKRDKDSMGNDRAV